MLVAQEPAPHGERLFQALCRGGIIALVRQHDTQVVKRLGQIGMLRVERGVAARERFFEQGLCFVEGTEATIDPAQHGQHPGPQLRLPGQLFLHLLGAGIEDPPNRRVGLRSLTVERIGGGQQAGEYFARLPSFRCLALRTVTLRLEAHGVICRQRRDQHDDGR